MNTRQNKSQAVINRLTKEKKAKKKKVHNVLASRKGKNNKRVAGKHTINVQKNKVLPSNTKDEEAIINNDISINKSDDPESYTNSDFDKVVVDSEVAFEFNEGLQGDINKDFQDAYVNTEDPLDSTKGLLDDIYSGSEEAFTYSEEALDSVESSFDAPYGGFEEAIANSEVKFDSDIEWSNDEENDSEDVTSDGEVTHETSESSPTDTHSNIEDTIADIPIPDYNFREEVRNKIGKFAGSKKERDKLAKIKPRKVKPIDHRSKKNRIINSKRISDINISKKGTNDNKAKEGNISGRAKEGKKLKPRDPIKVDKNKKPIDAKKAKLRKQREISELEPKEPRRKRGGTRGQKKWVPLDRRIDKPDRQPQKRTGLAASGKWRSATAKKRDDDKIKSERKSQIVYVLMGAMMYAAAIFCYYYYEFEPVINMLLYLAAGLTLIIPVLTTIATHIGKRKLLDENLLILIATVGAFYYGMHIESVGVLLIFQFGKMIERLVLINTKKSIADNIDIKPEKANLKKGSYIAIVDPKELIPKQRILIKPGETIPVDAVVTDGRSMVDTKALTGESEPSEVKIGSKIFGGCVNLSAPIEARVAKTYKESTVAKILELVTKVEEQKPEHEFSVEEFMRLYTPAVIVLSALVIYLPPMIILGENPDVWLSRGIIFLIAACPGGLLASIPIAYYGGIGAALKHGILVKGAAYLEKLSNAEAFLFDKTGTLTEGVFKINGIYPRNIEKETLLSIAAHAESHSMHPIATSIKRTYGYKRIDESRVGNIREITGFGVECTVDGNEIIIGNARHLNKHGIFCHLVKRIGTAVHVAVNGKYAGYILLSDQIRPDVPGLMKWLRRRKREIVIMSGDNERIVEDVRIQLGIDVGFSNLLPEDKLDYLSAFVDSKMENEAIVFVGDGLNDALVLAQADVGIAMGGMGADAALEAADIVLLEDEPSKIINAVKIANNTNRTIRENMIFAVFMKVIMLSLAVAGLITMQQAILVDLGVMLILVLNAYWISKQYVYVNVWPDEDEPSKDESSKDESSKDEPSNE